MDNSYLKEIHAILTAQAKAESMIAYIDGWTLFQNSDAGPYVGMYNSRKKYRECRVYVNGWEPGKLSPDFRKLPKSLQRTVLDRLDKEPAPEAPRSEETEPVKSKGLLNECNRFKIVRFKYADKAEGEINPWQLVECFEFGAAQQASVQPAPALPGDMRDVPPVDQNGPPPEDNEENQFDFGPQPIGNDRAEWMADVLKVAKGCGGDDWQVWLKRQVDRLTNGSKDNIEDLSLPELQKMSTGFRNFLAQRLAAQPA